MLFMMGILPFQQQNGICTLSFKIYEYIVNCDVITDTIKYMYVCWYKTNTNAY